MPTTSSPLGPKSFAFAAMANGMPAVIIQITELFQSYMIWVGAINTDITSSETNVIERLAATRGSLAKDWACAMPPLSSGSMPAGTTLLRLTSEETACPMAQRLARRLNKQIFLSVDVPASLGDPGQATHVLLYVERMLVESLIDFEKSRQSNVS